jgi:hypothetical protein
MKKEISKKAIDQLINYPIQNVRKGWRFNITELSQSYFIVSGIDESGHTLSREGTNPDDLLLQCGKDIDEFFFN